MSADEPLSEEAIAALLKANDGPVDFGGEQRERLRQRIPALRGIEQETLVDQRLRIDPEPLEISIVADRETSPARRRLLPIAAALVFVVAVFSLALLRPNSPQQTQLETSDDQSVVLPTSAPTPEPVVATTEPAGVVFCRNTYGPLLDAVDVWGGVDTWIFLLDRRLPEPDLALLSQQAIAAADLLVDDPDFEDLALRLGELRDDVEPASAEDAPEAWSSEEIEAHRTAVTDSLTALDRLVGEQGWTVHAGCDR